MISIESRHRQTEAQLFQTRVHSIVELTDDLFVLNLTEFPSDFRFDPGMFLHIKVSAADDPLLRRPFSIQSYQQGVAEILIREVGIGTRILHGLKRGDYLDTLGPLGTRFSPIRKDDAVLMVGGGVGIAPLIASCRECPEGGRVDLCYGARTQKEIQGIQAFENGGGNIHVHVSTDDGSSGYKGFCTDLAGRLMAERQYTKVFTCGPWAMMKKAAGLAAQASLPIEASLEVQMGCGLGACLSCVYQTTGGDYIRSCIDGPVVDGKEVAWEA